VLTGSRYSRLLPALFLIMMILMGSASTAQAGWLEFFFPSLRNTVDQPSRTLVAPFAEQGQAIEKLPTATSLPELPENRIPLDQAHRSASEMAEWLTMSVSEVLTFKNANLNDVLEQNKKYFDANGQAQFVAFMNEKNMTKVLETGNFNMHPFVQQTPLVLNQGVVDGRYRWLFEVPVMVSYLERGTKGYTKNTKPVNQEIVLTLQIGRTTDLSAGKDVVIERWTGKLRGAP
jgi:Type-IV b secretion system, inner-membrane complex component